MLVGRWVEYASSSTELKNQTISHTSVDPAHVSGALIKTTATAVSGGHIPPWLAPCPFLMVVSDESRASGGAAVQDQLDFGKFGCVYI